MSPFFSTTTQRCVCGHIKALHKGGVCQARINPCGCTSFETQAQADKPSNAAKHTTYQGQYSRKFSA